MVEQGSPEWHAMRCGKVTASKIADMMARTKSGWGASRANYKAQLVAERLTGTIAEGFTNAAMEWGKENEADARIAYEFYHNHVVEPVDFIDHPSIRMSGASPDGLVPTNGLVEIKCPNTATHIEWLLGQGVPDRYVKQMQWQMACTGREWCDFASYDPRMPERMRLLVRRLERDDGLIREIAGQVAEFEADVTSTVRQLQSLYAPAG